MYVAQVQAQNKHSRGPRLKGSALILQAALPILISTKAGLGSAQRQQQGDEKDEAAGRAVRLR